MIVKGWNNGNSNNLTGSGYGIKLPKEDRDKYFHRSWKFVTIQIDKSVEFEVKISNSFWNNCIELRSKKIGKYLLNQGLAPWVKYNPPILNLKYIKENRFHLSQG